MRRFYVDQAFPAVGASVTLSEQETFHLQQVLRLKKGDKCRIFNKQGIEAEAVVKTFWKKGECQLEIRNLFPGKPHTLFLKVAQALPQKKKMDELVDRAQELGVQELWILETERTVVKMGAEGIQRARTRWEKIAIEAAKQSGSSLLMRIEGPIPFQKILQQREGSFQTSFLFHPDPTGLSFSQCVDELTDRLPELSPVSLFFGPEGGFTEEEVRLAESQGIRKVFLGASVLRLETAFVGVISALRFLIP